MPKTTKKVRAWLDIAMEDLSVARDLLKSGRYVYCAFFCQQALEKLFKAMIIFETGQEPPYVHDLTVLAKTASVDTGDEEKLRILTLHYIKGRYNTDRKKLPANSKKIGKDLLSFTEEVFECSLMKFK